MFRARIKCKCGYDYLTAQTDPKMTIWAGEKLMKIHQKSCDQDVQIVFSNDEPQKD